MTISLAIALGVYLACTAVVAIFVLIDLYHLAESASLTSASFLVTACVLAFMAAVLLETAMLLSDVDWQTPILSPADDSFLNQAETDF